MTRNEAGSKLMNFISNVFVYLVYLHTYSLSASVFQKKWHGAKTSPGNPGKRSNGPARNLTDEPEKVSA